MVKTGTKTGVKTGRNEACPCGSGKKYKRCCLPRDQAVVPPASPAPGPPRIHGMPPQYDGLQYQMNAERYDALADASDAVAEMIDAGQLDEAEKAAQALVEAFPDAYDGYARLGLIFEIRGENRKAADYYRKVIAFARDHAPMFGPSFEAGYQALIDRLDPSPSTSGAKT